MSARRTHSAMATDGSDLWNIPRFPLFTARLFWRFSWNRTKTKRKTPNLATMSFPRISRLHKPSKEDCRWILIKILLQKKRSENDTTASNFRNVRLKTVKTTKKMSTSQESGIKDRSVCLPYSILPMCRTLMAYTCPWWRNRNICMSGLQREVSLGSGEWRHYN